MGSSLYIDAELLVGLNPVLEQLRRDPGKIRKIRVAKGAGGRMRSLVEEAGRAGIEVVFDDARRLAAIGRGVPHQGVVAEIAAFSYTDFHELLERKPACIVVADQITDPRNLGALVRSAAGAGAGGVVIPRDRSAGVTAATAKASAGATATVPIAQVSNLARALEELKRAGYWIVGLDADGAESLFSFVFPDVSALVVGSEGKGLRPLTRASCDHLVSIPMAGGVESLNVSVAGAVALFERLRQRHRIDSPQGG